jgi:cytidine deaminase
MQNIKKLTKKDRELVEIAKQHSQKQYREGITSMAAALRTKKGTVFTGINVKYKPVWRCICAERVAIAKAIESGETAFDTIVTVKYFPEDNDFAVINMCGECRQMAIFHSPLSVIAVNNKMVQSVPIEKVFPYPYA